MTVFSSAYFPEFCVGREAFYTCFLTHLELKVTYHPFRVLDSSLLIYLSFPLVQITTQPVLSLKALLRAGSLSLVLFFHLKYSKIKNIFLDPSFSGEKKNSRVEILVETTKGKTPKF